ncbi:MAG: hypothetical protein ACI4WZ_03675 [Eubacteriales bacterium]
MEQNPLFPEVVDRYTEQQYNSFGWVRSNGILTSEQYNDFSSKFADIKSGRVKGTPVSKDGYYMIAVGGLTDGTGFGVDNIVVLAKGSLENPEIGRIYEIFGDNETYLGEERKNIYESELRGIRPEIEELFRRYDSTSYVSTDERKGIQSDGYRSGNGNGGGSRPQAERAAKRIVEYDFENGTVTYADGTKEADPDSTKQESRNGSEKEAADRRSPETGKSDLPDSLSSLPYGARRYQIGGNDFILIKTDRNGYDGYEIRDNESGRWSKVLDRAQAEKVLKSIKTASETAQNTELSSALKSAGEYAEKNIPEYRRLMEPGKAAVRNTIMQARIYGLSDADVKLYARISSKSGLNIVFDPKLGIYEDSKGYYNNGTVFIDPNEGKESSFRKILAHENGHALIEAFPKLGRKIERFALKHIDTEKRNRTIELYRNYFGDHISKEALLDEINSAYAEEMAETDSFWEYLLSDEPTIKEKVLSFFGNSAQKYSFEEGLSREARKYMTMYRKMFNRFSEINRGNNSFAGDALIRSDNAKKGDSGRHAIKDTEKYGKVAYIDEDVLERKPGQSLKEAAEEYFRKYLSGMEIEVESSGDTVKIKQSKKYLFQADKNKLLAVQILDDIISVARDKRYSANHALSEEGIQKKHSGFSAARGWDRYVTYYEIGDKLYQGRLYIRKSGDGSDYFYDLNIIKEIGNVTAEQELNPAYAQNRNSAQERITPPTDNSISQTSEKINTSEKKITEISEKNPDIRRSLKDTATDNITESDLKSLRAIGRKSINGFTSEEIQATEKWARKFYRELGTKSPFFRAWFGDWRAYDNKTVPVLMGHIKTYSSSTEGSNIVKENIKNNSAYRGNIKNEDTGFDITISSKVYNDTLTYANRELSRSRNTYLYSARISLLDNLPEICRTAVLLDTEVANSDAPDRAFVHKFYAIAEMGNSENLIKLTVDEFNSQNGDIRRAYNLKSIEISPATVSQVYKPAGIASDRGDFVSTISISDLFDLVKQYDQEFSPNTVNPVLLNEDGTPKKFYHQTEEDFTEFDLSRKTNSESDSETPNGIFLKSSDSDIGIRGNIQMELYASVSNTLTFPNREAAAKWYSDHIPGYQEISQKIKNIDRIYNERYDKQEKICDDFYESHYDDVISGRMSEEEFQRGAEEGLDRILEDWKSKSDKAGTAARKLLDRYFEESDYDSIYLRNDKGSNGRKTDALIVFDKGNVKSATDNIGTFDRKNPDIRRSLKDDADISEKIRKASVCNRTGSTQTPRAKKKQNNSKSPFPVREITEQLKSRNSGEIKLP